MSWHGIIFCKIGEIKPQIVQFCYLRDVCEERKLKMERTEYSGAVKKLLEIGIPENMTEADQWPNYQTEYGISRADILELIRLATDKDFYLENAKEVYPESYFGGPIHALRVLGQLKAAQAIESLLEILKSSEWDDDATLETLPSVFGLIGPEALPFLNRALQVWYGKKYDHTAGTTIEAIEKIAANHPEARDAVIEILLDRLQTPEKNDDSLNGFLIASLTNLKAEKALPVIEKAFKRGLVDTMIIRWHTVQYELGLINKEEHDKTEKEFSAAQRAKFIAEREEIGLPYPDPSSGGNINPSLKKQKEKTKAKRKWLKPLK